MAQGAWGARGWCCLRGQGWRRAGWRCGARPLIRLLRPGTKHGPGCRRQTRFAPLAETTPETAAETADEVALAFDLARIEADGSGVIAGRAQPRGLRWP